LQKAELSDEDDSENYLGGSSGTMYYIGLDVHTEDDQLLHEGCGWLCADGRQDRIDAGKIADCLRFDFLPECHMASTEIRDRRRTLRYRGLLVKQMVKMKNRVSGLLLEKSDSYQAAAAQGGLLCGADVRQRRDRSEYPAVVKAEPGIHRSRAG
jgi:hypothetical protein